MSETPASDLLRADHRKMETHLDRLLYALKHLNVNQVETIRREFLAIREISLLHFDQEEKVFYPAVQPQAPQVLRQMDEEHQTVRETERGLEEKLEELPEPAAEPLTPRDMTELYRLGIEFHDAVETHIIDEEDHLLQLVDGLLSGAEQQSLAAAMAKLGPEPRP